MQVQYTDKISAKDGVKCCLYGDFGVGKTPLLATMPDPIILSAEEGLLSLRKQKVAYIDVSNYNDLREAAKWLASSAESKKYKSIGLDSLSEISEVIAAEERKSNSDPRKWVPEYRDQVGRMIRWYRDMPQRNVVFVCKQQTIPSAVVGVAPQAAPSIPNDKLQEAVPYFFDLVLHMYIYMAPDGTKFQALHTQKGDPLFQARDRSGNLDPIERPDLSYVFAKACS